MFQGAMTAMITPFRNGRVDYARLSAHVEFQIKGGIDGLVPMGTTGESPTLSHEEHREVIEHVVKAARGRVPVIAGTGSNSTAEALELTAHAASVGAAAALMVNPYYNKPTQEGLYRHFMAVADEVDIPIILYNIPGRTGITMSPQTVARLHGHKNIVAIKEATGSLDMASEIASLCGITILSGDDSLTLPLMSVGAKGVISVLSNLIPRRVKALTKAALARDYAAARKLHIELFPLFKGMFVETNPIPIKTAMAMAKMDSGELRLPLCELSKANADGLRKLLRSYKLI
ncbi:MAG: 4-hydroxy-tetrahydrodipicolinate synthase [Planctomycetes bacterium]|nr:4-hydroxy-tetrahydrodipicolinate synthase [Planctomycetota bacterium]